MIPQWLKRAADTTGGRLAAQLLRRYFVHDVARQGAALAYYLLFTLFPFLIFLSSLLGLLELDVTALMAAAEAVLPSGVLELLAAYLSHVERTSSAAMLWLGLTLSLYFSTRAANCLMRCVRRAYHLPRPRSRGRYLARVMLYTLFLMLSLAMTLALMSLGGRAVAFLLEALRLPGELVRLWNVLRFGVVALVAFCALGLLYAAAQDRELPVGAVVPGALAALACWLLFSAFYAFYVDHFGNYSAIYGALGAVMVLLIWLYLTAVVLIMGAEINGALTGLAGNGGRTGR